MQKFNYHSHTYRCGHADLDMQDEDYVKEYIKMGFRSIAFTDHCPEKNRIDNRPKIRMEYEQKNEYLNSIKKECKLPIITKYDDDFEMMRIENRVSNIYNIKKDDFLEEYKHKPIIH